MEARAIARYVRISPRKANRVMALIRGKSIEEARAILKFTPGRAPKLVEKVLNSAVANAVNNFELVEDDLYVAKAYADKGPVLKRYKVGSLGRVNPRKRYTSHLYIILQEKE
jgi:large subunit ribosomal protein L22